MNEVNDMFTGKGWHYVRQFLQHHETFTFGDVVVFLEKRGISYQQAKHYLRTCLMTGVVMRTRQGYYKRDEKQFVRFFSQKR